MFPAKSFAAKFGLLLAAYGALAAWAKEPSIDSPGSPDPPLRVARPSYLHGAVSFRPAGVDEWGVAQLNRPVTSGDSVWTESGARAELHAGDAAFRLDARTSIGLLTLDDRLLQVKLTEGVLNVRLRRLDEGETLEIDTPNVSFTLLRPGEYRFEVSGEGGTLAIVRTGEMEAGIPSQVFTVRARQEARISGFDAPSFEIGAARPPDGFDTFCQSRDGREDRAASSGHVSRQMLGYEDLDEYGEWRVHPSYGSIWAPRVVPGWAPYRFGRWIWMEPWGWTWVDDAPWGFAPFHYGRWAVFAGVWVWVPGPVHIRPVWSPALVVFAGGGGTGFHFNFRVGAGAGVAWFPLGPGEVYIPPYRASRTYIANVNISNTMVRNTARIHEVNMAKQHYVNQTAPGGMTAVDREAFTSGRPLEGRAIPVPDRDARIARIGGAAAPFAPVRESVLPAGGAPRPSEPVVNRRVVVRQMPPPSQVPFADRQRSLEAKPGRPLDNREVEYLQRARPAPAPEVRAVPRSVPGNVQRSTPRAADKPAGPSVESDRKWEQRSARDAEKRDRAVQQERQRIDRGKPRPKRQNEK